jgi:RND superfamily putative drug exporter
MSKPLSDNFSVPGIPSEKAADLQAELFPGSTDAFDQAGVNVVVAAPEGHTPSEPAYRNAVDALVAELKTAPQMPTDPAASRPTPSTPRRRSSTTRRSRRCPKAAGSAP